MIDTFEMGATEWQRGPGGVENFAWSQNQMCDMVTKMQASSI